MRPLFRNSILLALFYFFTMLSSAQRTVTPAELSAFEAKAQQGDQAAMVRVGLIYFGKQGIPADYAKATSWLDRAATGGSFEARMALGAAYMSGTGVARDHAIAAQYLLQVAEAPQVTADQKGSQALAQFFLSHLYLEGSGVEKSVDRATHFLELAAANANYPAQFELGSIYNDGARGKPKDMKLACSWWEKAADQGHTLAAHNVAFCYQLGLGGTTNMERALHYYTLAAEAGKVDSAHNLGLLYGKNGNASQAYFWLSVAKARGMTSDEKQIAYSASCLLPEDRKKVDAQLATWLETHSAGRPAPVTR